MNLRVRRKVYEIFIQLILIIVGVLSALAVENYRQTLQEHRTEKEYLISLRHALRADTIMLKKEIQRTYTKINAINEFLASADARTAVEEEKFGDIITDVLMLVRPNHITAVYEELKFTGNFKLIENNELKEGIISYYDDISIIKQENEKRSTYPDEFVKGLTLDELDFRVPFDQKRIFKDVSNNQPVKDELRSVQKSVLILRTTMIYTSLPTCLNLLEKLQAEIDARD